MEVKIGVRQASRELTIDTQETAEAVEEALAKALVDGTTLALTDSRGRRVLVPAAHIAYVEIGTGTAGQVGFRS